MQTEKINAYLNKLSSKIYDSIFDIYQIKYNIWPIRSAVFLFLVLNFHLINKNPILQLDLINITEILYLIYSIVLFLFVRRTLSVKTQFYKLVFDFVFITTFEILSLSMTGVYSWLYVLYLIPVIYCSFWFNWLFTIIFVTFVSAVYSFLNNYILSFGGKFETFYERISILGPMVVIFYLIALGVIYYKKKVQKSNEDKEVEVKERTAELKQHTIELEKEKLYTRSLLVSSMDGFIAINEDGVVKEANERALDLLGYDSEEIHKLNVKKIYGQGEPNRIMNMLRQSQDGTIENEKAIMQTKDKERIPILLSASFLYDEESNLKEELSKGKKFPCLGYFRDIRAEEIFDAIARDISFRTNEKELFEEIVKIVCKALTAETCSLLIYNENNGLLMDMSSYGKHEVLRRGKIGEAYTENEGMTGNVFFWGETLNISDIDVQEKQPQHINIKWRYAQNFAKYSRFRDFKHFLGTPLVVGGEVYGVIRVLNKYCSDNELDKKGFTESDEKLLERIANQISFLVEKVRDKGRFNAISEVGKKLNEMLDVPLDDLLETIAKEVVIGMRFKACYLRLLEGSDNLTIKASYGLKGDYKNKEEFILKIGQGIVGNVVKNEKHRVIKYLRKNKKFYHKKILEGEELGSMLSIPLKYRNRVIGVINCYTRRIHEFTEQEIQIMDTFATYASIAIQNKKRMDELYALNEISSELVKPIGIDKLFDLILERAKTLSGADRLCIKVYEEQSRTLRTICSLNCKWHEKHKDYIIDIGEGLGADILGELIEDGKSRIISNYDEILERLEDVPESNRLNDVKSCALVPVKIDNKVYGVLFIESHRYDFFTADALLILEAFSSQAAIALKNAKFFNKLQRVTETFPKISELNVDIDKVLHNIADIAAEVLETDVLVLYRYDEKNKKIIWPPIFKGDIMCPEHMMSQVDESDAPLLFINRGETHYAENSQKDPIMVPGQEPRNGVPQRFLFREHIASSAGIVLKVGKEIVGVMFINYRTHHKFDEDERKIIENYASYIAIAIQNVGHFSEKEAGTALKTLAQLAAVIAHKIKNDIGTINLYTGDLIDETDLEDTRYFNLIQIKEKLHKITSDIDFLLDASKLKIPEKKFIDIKNLVNEMEHEILSDLKIKNIELEKKIAANLPKIRIDPNQIKMVLSNLVYNSIDAMPEGGRISISISKLKNVVLLDWKDTGTGISPTDAEKVFQPFWTTKGRGFGLGLFLSKTVIEEHGGSISLDINYKKGTKFIIRFPIKE